MQGHMSRVQLKSRDLKNELLNKILTLLNSVALTGERYQLDYKLHSQNSSINNSIYSQVIKIYKKKMQNVVVIYPF